MGCNRLGFGSFHAWVSSASIFRNLSLGLENSERTMVRRSMSLATPKGFGVMDRSHRDRLWTVERPQKTAVPEPRDRRAREGGCSGDGSVSFQVSPPQGNLPLRSILESRPSCPSPSRLFGNLVRVPSRTRVPPRFLDRRSFWLEETGTRAWGFGVEAGAPHVEWAFS